MTLVMGFEVLMFSHTQIFEATLRSCKSFHTKLIIFIRALNLHKPADIIQFEAVYDHFVIYGHLYLN